MKEFDEIENQTAKYELLKIIKENSLFIGSRAWGVAKTKSDYDYLIRYEKLQDIFKIIEEKYPHLWTYKRMFKQSWGDSCDQDRLREFYSIIIDVNAKIYNIISPMDLINYKAWRKSAHQLKKFIGDDIINDKSNRVRLFECFKDIYRDKFNNYPRKVKQKVNTPIPKIDDNFPF